MNEDQQRERKRNDAQLAAFMARATAKGPSNRVPADREQARQDEQHQREIWQRRCPELLALKEQAERQAKEWESIAAERGTRMDEIQTRAEQAERDREFAERCLGAARREREDARRERDRLANEITTLAGAYEIVEQQRDEAIERANESDRALGALESGE